MDVTLVCMPVVEVSRPSLSLGLLKAILAEGGISCSVVNAHVHYLEWAGHQAYKRLNQTNPIDQIGEWVFAEAAFGDTASSPEIFADALNEDGVRLDGVSEDGLAAYLASLRASASGFIDWIADMVLAERPRIVGCTSTFQQHVASLALLKALRARQPDLMTVMGGANLETVMGRATHERFPWVDVTVSGEADDIVVSLFRRLLDRGPDIPPDEAPLGVFVPAHRTMGYPVSEKTADGLPRRTIDDLRGLPAPDFDEYFRDLKQLAFPVPVQPWLLLELSRGCWWGQRSHCTFCGLNGSGMDYRAKDAEEAESLFAKLYDRYGLKRMEVVDNILALEYFDTLLPKKSFKDAGYQIVFETKSNIKERHVALLAAAGVVMVQPGIESLHSEILRLMGKGVTAIANIRVLRLCREYGIRTAWSVIRGFPGERDGWYAEMASLPPLLAHLNAPSLVSLRYDRHSPYQRTPDRFGIKLTPVPSYAHIYPDKGPEVADHAYFFQSEDSEMGGRSVLDVPQPRHPGLEAFRQGVVAWRAAQQGRHPAVLTVVTDDNGAAIHDTRPAFGPVTYRLDRTDARVLAALVDGLTPKQLKAQARERDVVDVADLELRLAALIDRGLVVALDGYLLALPCRLQPVQQAALQTVLPAGVLSGEGIEPGRQVVQ